MKTNIKVILLFVLCGLSPLVTNHFLKVKDPISFITLFCLIIVYTFQFIGAFNLWFRDKISFFILTIVIVIGLFLIPPQVIVVQYSDLVPFTIAYASVAAIITGYATGRSIY